MHCLHYTYCLIIDILDDYSKVKTMIVCLNSEEAMELNDFLASKSVQTLLVHEEIPITKVNGNQILINVK